MTLNNAMEFIGETHVHNVKHTKNAQLFKRIVYKNEL